jgi:sterol desaturase/sphingolipid hydroxylase (fatty acid hydroxylase superfamily)
MQFTWDDLQNWSLRPTLGYVAGSFLVLAAVLWPLEKLFPARREQRVRRAGFLTDLVFWFFTPLVSKAVTYALVVLAVGTLLPLVGRPSDLSILEGWGPVGAQPLWLQFVEVVLIADLIFYWTHRWFHTTRLWPFHAVHHSGTEMDWLSSMRFHPLNDTLTRLCQAIPLFLLGFSPVAVVAMVPIVVLFIVVTHANVPWTWGPLRYVLVSPVYHQWHHSCETEALDKNFAGVLPLWDVLFGTLHFPAGQRPSVFGVKEGDVPNGVHRQMVYPFVKLLRSPIK